MPRVEKREILTQTANIKNAVRNDKNDFFMTIILHHPLAFFHPLWYYMLYEKDT